MTKEESSRISPDNVNNLSTEQAVTKVRAMVENALRTIPNPLTQIKIWDDPRDVPFVVKRYLHRLSTIDSDFKTGQGVENNELLDMCSLFTPMIASALEVAQIPYKLNITKTHKSLMINHKNT